MRLTRLAGPLLLLLLTGTAGCGKPGPAAGAEPPRGPRLGGTFLSSEITVAGKPHALVPGTRVSLTFTDDTRLVATAGCNSMSGPVRVDGGTLAVDDLATTDLGCDKPRHTQDEWLAGVLGAGPRWKLDGSTLTLTTADTTLVLTDREVADPDLSLVETTWALDTLVDGQTAAEHTRRRHRHAAVPRQAGRRVRRLQQGHRRLHDDRRHDPLRRRGDDAKVVRA